MDRSEEINVRVSKLWGIAEARRNMGEPIRRNLLGRIAYAPPPGDGDSSARAWLTEVEATEVHALSLEYQIVARREAIDRIKKKYRGVK